MILFFAFYKVFSAFHCVCTGDLPLQTVRLLTPAARTHAERAVGRQPGALLLLSRSLSLPPVRTNTSVGGEREMSYLWFTQ